MLFVVDGRAGLLPDDGRSPPAATAGQARPGRRQQDRGRGRRRRGVRAGSGSTRMHRRSRPSTARAWATCSTTRARGPAAGGRCPRRSTAAAHRARGPAQRRQVVAAEPACWDAERAVVSAIPGTTRDAGGQPARARTASATSSWTPRASAQSRHLKENVDHVSVVQARRSIDRADVALPGARRRPRACGRWTRPSPATSTRPGGGGRRGREQVGPGARSRAQDEGVRRPACATA